MWSCFGRDEARPCGPSEQLGVLSKGTCWSTGWEQGPVNGSGTGRVRGRAGDRCRDSELSETEGTMPFLHLGNCWSAMGGNGGDVLANLSHDLFSGTVFSVLKMFLP